MKHTKMKNKTGSFGNSNTRKNTVKCVQNAFFARISAVRLQKKKVTHQNVVDHLVRRGFCPRILNAMAAVRGLQ
jgi:hypothetical protein